MSKVIIFFAQRKAVYTSSLPVVSDEEPSSENRLTHLFRILGHGAFFVVFFQVLFKFSILINSRGLDRISTVPAIIPTAIRILVRRLSVKRRHHQNAFAKASKDFGFSFIQHIVGEDMAVPTRCRTQGSHDCHANAATLSDWASNPISLLFDQVEGQWKFHSPAAIAPNIHSSITPYSLPKLLDYTPLYLRCE
jgi:hypothetical protein